MLRNRDTVVEDTRETGRIEAFSDGVFAIAITLLILEIKVPHEAPESKGLTDDLLKLWPSYLAFVVSFFNILVMWLNHHRLFKHIKRVDTWLLLANGFLLLLVSFIPFSTAVMAEYLGKHDQSIAAIFYNGTSIVMAIAFNVLWYSASYKKRLLDPQADPKAVRAITVQYYYGVPLFTLVLIVSLFNAVAGLILNTLLAFFFATPGANRRSVANV